MELFEAITTRRSIGKVKEDQVPLPLIEKVLEAATWAPNHHRTEPWRFVVLQDDGRQGLGRVYAEIALEKDSMLTDEERDSIYEKQMAKAFRAPVIIAVIVTPGDQANVIKQEEVAAGNAAVQNMLLAAHALGLGAIWRTGKPAYHNKMKSFFGCQEKDEIVGLIYLGYSDLKVVPPPRISFREKTIWVSEDHKSIR
ncbi:nitroreductase family protein [Hazenella coriacea]|uniref:Putative NAD(P)H nitroreductase n=1 Tax=Hazenella coriacea TaxID=1179467 RepID=A0A4R3LEE3_9BACL|nr:nitroreductase [Hazenella coriacea]TCS96714.1 nitroreductase [Hazenella coriacea]